MNIPSICAKMKPVIIVEGAELTGKSFIISQLYRALQPRFQTHPHILNGCHWFNNDVGLLGDVSGERLLEHHTNLIESLPDRLIILEKFHLSHAIYAEIYSGADFRYNSLESRLAERGAVLLLCALESADAIWQQRLAERLRLYPHYGRIAQKPAGYQQQQELYQQRFDSSQLPKKRLDTTHLPNDQLITSTLRWLENYLQ